MHSRNAHAREQCCCAGLHVVRQALTMHVQLPYALHMHIQHAFECSFLLLMLPQSCLLQNTSASASCLLLASICDRGGND